MNAKQDQPLVNLTNGQQAQFSAEDQSSAKESSANAVRSNSVLSSNSERGLQQEEDLEVSVVNAIQAQNLFPRPREFTISRFCFRQSRNSLKVTKKVVKKI